MMNNFKTGSIKANGINFSFIEGGEGPLILFLHGFPDHAPSFSHQIRYFARKGYRVVAPFMRGYSPTETPADSSYQSAELGNDVIALIDALKYTSAVVVGHDWGATAAYSAAIINPEKISRLITMAIPRGSFFKALLENSLQQKRSWYMYFFQLPFAEKAFQHNDFAFIDMLWKDWSMVEWDFSDQIASVKNTFRKEGVASSALNYYRHLFNHSNHIPHLADVQKRIADAVVKVPALYIHGKNDNCIGVELIEGMDSYFPAGLEKKVISDSGHFVHIEKPDEVNRIIDDYLNINY